MQEGDAEISHNYGQAETGRLMLNQGILIVWVSCLIPVSGLKKKKRRKNEKKKEENKKKEEEETTQKVTIQQFQLLNYWTTFTHARVTQSFCIPALKNESRLSERCQWTVLISYRRTCLQQFGPNLLLWT